MFIRDIAQVYVNYGGRAAIIVDELISGTRSLPSVAQGVMISNCGVRRKELPSNAYRLSLFNLGNWT